GIRDCHVTGVQTCALPIFAASRAFLQARTTTRPLVVGVVVANVINLPLTWLLVFGDRALTDLGLPALGVPMMGTAGAGLASAVGDGRARGRERGGGCGVAP